MKRRVALLKRAGAAAAGALLLVAPVTRAGAQSEAGAGIVSSYRDVTARRLHEAAMSARERTDESVIRYTAVVRQRVGVRLRMPLKDRTLYRSESAHRLFWNRDAENLVQVLALREQTPDGVTVDSDLDRFTRSFDPMDDRLLFGFASRDDDLGDPNEDDFWFEHPLYPDYTDAYWFSSGDTLTLSLPDGRQVVAIELQVVPRVADVHRMTGALWLEPETGSLVRAVYRLSDTFDAFRDLRELREDEDLGFVPGILKPWTAEITMIAVDYAFWDFEVWLPRSMRIEGVIGAGIVKAPITLDFAYEMESVTTEHSLRRVSDGDDLPEIHFRTRSEAMAYLTERAFGAAVPYELEMTSGERGEESVRILVPRDRAVLAESPSLPPPIWEDAPGFTSEAELADMFDRLADLPLASLPAVPTTFRWGLQRPDLLRFNRVEALSVGVRAQARPSSFMGPLSVTGTLRLGVADLEPNARLDVARENLRRRVTFSLFSELTSIDENARHLGIGNSLMAAFFGRDDGDYYRRSGAALEWTPPSTARRSFRVQGYAEYHRAADVETDFALFKVLDGSWAFRPNLVADEGWEYGGVVEVSPWWGTDPKLAQGGVDLTVQGGVGDFEYVRTSLVGRVIFPLSADFRVGLESAVGTSWGSPSAQRLWYVGGPRTLRGYTPRVGEGGSFGRGRVELARAYPFGSLLLFSDVAWAGDRDAIDLDDAFYSIGVGASLIDGLIRLDAAYGIRDPGGFRLDFYLDAIM